MRPQPSWGAAALSALTPGRLLQLFSSKADFVTQRRAPCNLRGASGLSQAWICPLRKLLWVLTDLSSGPIQKKNNAAFLQTTLSLLHTNPMTKQLAPEHKHESNLASLLLLLTALKPLSLNSPPVGGSAAEPKAVITLPECLLAADPQAPSSGKYFSSNVLRVRGRFSGLFLADFTLGYACCSQCVF